MIGIISVTKRGDIIADKIQCKFDGKVYKKSNVEDFSLIDITKKSFENHKYIVFISSTGIAVRAISNFLKGKDVDPAVIVVDVCNNFTISLVSGHLGGANSLTMDISRALKNTPVITTATDNLEVEAPDIIALNNNLIIDDLKIAKVIASRIVNNEEVFFKDDKNMIPCPNGYVLNSEVSNNTLWITSKLVPDKGYSREFSQDYLLNLYRKNNILKLIRKEIVLGIGCRRNTESEKLYDFVKSALVNNNIDIRAVKTIASIDIKNDEVAILNLAKKLGCDIKFFSKSEISTIENKFVGSEFVKNVIGVKAVSEPVVELLGAEIINGKIKYEGITLTIGEIKNFK